MCESTIHATNLTVEIPKSSPIGEMDYDTTIHNLVLDTSVVVSVLCTQVIHPGVK